MNHPNTKFSSLILIALAAIFTLLLGFYSVRHFPVSLMNYALKIISLEKDSSSDNAKKNYYQNLEETISLAKKASLKENDNSETYLYLSKFCFDAFNLESDKKSLILESINPSAKGETYRDGLFIKEIYKLLYPSLQHSPSNYRPFLYLSKLVNLRLNTSEGAIDSKDITEAQSLTSHYIETALRISPSKAQISYAAGKYYLQIGEVEKAGTHFRKSLNSNSNLSKRIFSEISYEQDKDKIIGIILEKNPDLQMSYGDFLIQRKNFIEAERIYESSFDLSAEKMEPYRKLCQLYFTIGKNEEIKAISEKILEEGYAKKQSDLSEVFYNIALYFENEKNLSSAIEFAQKAIDKNNEEIKNYYLLSRLHLKNGDLDEAISNSKFILSHFNGEDTKNLSKDIYLLLGEAYEKKDDIIKAHEEYNKALKLQPNNKEIQKRINYLRKGLR